MRLNVLFDLDPYGGTDPLGMFPLLWKRTADVQGPRFSVVFRRLLRLGSFGQGSVLGPLLFLLYTLELFSILENKLIGYADDSTLIAVVPYPDVRVTVAESLNRDLVRENA